MNDTTVLNCILNNIRFLFITIVAEADEPDSIERTQRINDAVFKANFLKTQYKTITGYDIGTDLEFIQ
jgi:hypothetical protein